jgi:cell shape-determining protein MreC
MHNSTPEYASSASILKPIKKKFLKKWFSPQISSKPLSPQETELKKREKKKKKKDKKEKLQKSPQIKGKLTFWVEEDTSTSKILFDVISFSPPPSYHFKNNF